MYIARCYSYSTCAPPPPRRKGGGGSSRPVRTTEHRALEAPSTPSRRPGAHRPVVRHACSGPSHNPAHIARLRETSCLFMRIPGPPHLSPPKPSACAAPSPARQISDSHSSRLHAHTHERERKEGENLSIGTHAPAVCAPASRPRGMIEILIALTREGPLEGLSLPAADPTALNRAILGRPMLQG